MIEAGKILQQRYRIDKQIGQGGMGAVYVATDERFGSVVAIKETLCMDDNYRKAIEREARLLNSLKHTALPRVSDHFLEENGQFLVMEYIPGEDLSNILEASGTPFEVEQVLTWADQLLDALDFLHNQENPVIHRDIKPQNLKVTRSGQIILLDFGLAKGNPTGAGHQTAAKSIFGYSRNYASLEQIQGTGTDPRSDLYSLAATLYHLLTGVAPEDALTRAMSVLSQQPDPLLPANLIRANIPTGVAGVLSLALDLNAGQRPESAAVMRQMLLDHQNYKGITSADTTPVRVVDTDAFGQKTQMLPRATINSDSQTNIKTEILPQYLSQVTDVRPLAAVTKDSERRPSKKFFAAAAAAALLLVGTVVASVYFYEISLSGGSEPQPFQAITVTDAPEPEEPAFETTEPTETAEPVADTERKTVDSVVRTVESEKKPKLDTKPKAPSNTGEDEIVMDGDTVRVGNMTIKNGRVETPDSIIDENGVTSKLPDVQPLPPFNPTNLKNLTPEQRRRLRIIRRSNPPAVPKQPPN